MTDIAEWRFVDACELRSHARLGAATDDPRSPRAPWIEFQSPYREFALDVPAFTKAAPWEPWFPPGRARVVEVERSVVEPLLDGAGTWDWRADRCVTLDPLLMGRLLNGPLWLIRSVSPELQVVGSPLGVLVEVGRSAHAGAMLSVTGRVSVAFVRSMNVSARALRQSIRVWAPAMETVGPALLPRFRRQMRMLSELQRDERQRALWG